MSEYTSIEWCDSSWNAWSGCAKISPGCDNCYAEKIGRRFGTKWGPGAPRKVASEKIWGDPIRWNRNPFYECQDCGHRGPTRLKERDSETLPPYYACNNCKSRNIRAARRRVFCFSMADVFDNEAPEGARDRFWSIVKACENIDFLLLTKRIGNAEKMLPADWGDGYPNVWLGATIVNQAEADRDILKLLRIPARIRFLSCEPLLGPISLDCWPIYGPSREQLINWIIVGGESGHGARPMHPNWARSLRDQCAEAGVPFLFKQNGAWILKSTKPDDIRLGSKDFGVLHESGEWFESTTGWNGRDEDDCGEAYMVRVPKHRAGRLLDGIEHNGFPK